MSIIGPCLRELNHRTRDRDLNAKERRMNRFLRCLFKLACAERDQGTILEIVGLIHPAPLEDRPRVRHRLRYYRDEGHEPGGTEEHGAFHDVEYEDTTFGDVEPPYIPLEFHDVEYEDTTFGDAEESAEDPKPIYFPESEQSDEPVGPQ